MTRDDRVALGLAAPQLDRTVFEFPLHACHPAAIRRVIVSALTLLALVGLHAVVAPVPALAACAKGVDPCCDSVSEPQNPFRTSTTDPGCDTNDRPSIVWPSAGVLLLTGGVALAAYQIVRSRRKTGPT